jgi:hypothetical protein
MALLHSDTARPDEPAAEAAKRDLEECDEQRGKRDVLHGFPLIRHTGLQCMTIGKFGSESAAAAHTVPVSRPDYLRNAGRRHHAGAYAPLSSTRCR